MRYQPQTSTDARQMLDAIGVDDLDALFAVIPESLRLKEPLDLPPSLGEQALAAHMKDLAERNDIALMRTSFLGAGSYEHYIPEVVNQLMLRSEYLTSYTPYQAEMSQGTLKAIFEFQTMVSEILGFELANASMYDGAHASAEALLMALRLKRKSTQVLVSLAVHPEYRTVCETYLGHREGVYQTLPVKEGITDIEALSKMDLSDVAAVMVQSPNFFGIVEDLEAISDCCKAQGVKFIVAFNEPLAYALVTPPGEAGADIAVGEGLSFGISPGFGGPALGLFACQKKVVRNSPGRLVARTTDVEGRESYILTLSTREQHIRRERATSNICTNQGLMALAATIYLCLLGKEGMVDLAKLNLSRAHYARRALCAIEGVVPTYPGAFFNEFVVTLPIPAAEVISFAASKGIAIGLDLGRFDEAQNHDLLIAVTEMNDRAQIDALTAVIAEALQTVCMSSE